MLSPETRVVKEEGTLLVHPNVVEVRLAKLLLFLKDTVKLETGLYDPTFLTLDTIMLEAVTPAASVK